jgi:hypothetical protein
MTNESFVYDELSDFIARMNPKKAMNFSVSKELMFFLTNTKKGI